ncbi:Aste57867_22112 [Aphanomyces stellatus]|uniref:Magnesium transporter n=1 Tax=Aphanomyces stellatus TaxID=120398 RepID=A0A485LKQ0_9STRA|nr:hypothetical protein As57867_022043 [Aphanomyces stellatus]VFT98780.1 Aste57867_22112 [Aphanomyces stellatus]
MLVSKNGEIVGGATTKSKRLALRFDATGHSAYEEVSRNDVLELIESGAGPICRSGHEATALAPPTAKNSRSRSRTRWVHDAPVDIPSVHMRDLRKLDNVFSASNEPSITVRHQAILVNCDPVRAVIMRNVTLVFLPDGADSLVLHLQTMFKKLLEDATTPFEFMSLEAILATICNLFSAECEKIVPRGREVLDKMACDDSMLSELENLRAIKNEMSALEAQVDGMRRLLMTLLENEVDMHMLYLTKLYKEPSCLRNLFGFDTDDAEAFLEVYLQTIYGIKTCVSLMTHNIHNTESIVMLKLDSKRNFLLSIDLSLTLMGTLLAVPTFVVGVFGMNLNSYIQQVDYVFWIVFAVCILLVVVPHHYIVKYLKEQGINMSWTY